MSDSTNSQSQTQSVQSQATATAATTAAKTGTDSHASSAAATGFTTSTKIDSLSALRTKAPKVYNAMMQGIAMNICNDMKHHQDRLKKLVREASNS